MLSENGPKEKLEKVLTRKQSLGKVKTSKQDFESRKEKNLSGFLEVLPNKTNDGEEPATVCKMTRNGKCSFFSLSKERANLQWFSRSQFNFVVSYRKLVFEHDNSDKEIGDWLNDGHYEYR